MEQTKIYRYPGVKPFSEDEQHVFYGRDIDTKKLHQLIKLEKLVLLYGKSGLGKSSLLNAGVIPIFNKEEDCITVKIRLGTNTDQSLTPVYTTLFKLPATSSNPVLDKLGAGSDTLWLRMKGLQYNEMNVPKTYILVFDQFEELFTYSKEDIKQFKRQLADLLFSKVPGYINKSITNRLREKQDFLSDEELEYVYRQPNIKVVLSIRSDRMSMLNTLADNLPDIQKNYYELKPLDRDSATDSILKPAQDKRDLYLSPAFEYTPDCTNKILNYLTENGEKSIETFQLQTVCQFVENLSIVNQLQYDEKGQTLIVVPGMLGDLQNIFRTQYDTLISNIEPLEKQLAVRLLIENNLIIDGNRVSLPDVVILKEKGIDRNLLAYLHDTHHILRSEPNTTGGISYELSHDTLVAPILKAKKEREEKEELARLETEKQAELGKQMEKAEKERLELAKARKRLRVVYSLLAIALLALITSVFLGIAANNAEKIASKAKDEAKQQQSITEDALASAKNQKYLADKAREDADINAEEAKRQQKKAEDALDEANKQKDLADNARKEANISAEEAKRQQKKAVGALDEANKQKDFADKARMDADNSAEEAKRQQKKAEDALDEANKQKDLADKARKDSESSNRKLQEFSNSAIGAKYKGGIIAWKDSTGKHGLIAAEKDMDGIYSWDSAKLVCKNYVVIEGDSIYKSWRLPKKGELNKLYINKVVIGGFSSDNYWSDWKSNWPTTRWFQRFSGSGYQYYHFKFKKFRVRAVRDF